jgi:hypothetical protein
MSGSDWISVKQYADLISAEVAAGVLSNLGIPNRIVGPPGFFASKSDDVLDRLPFGNVGAECYLWVPPESAEDAKNALEQAPLSDEELTALALKYPAPDDA